MLRHAARLCAERGWVSVWERRGVPCLGRTARSGPVRPLHARAGDDSRPGVYGLRGLHAPEDFARLASAATATSESIARDLRAGLRKGVDVIDDLDDISDAVCSVVDVAELCRNTHADERWVRAAENAYVDLQAYVHSLNADRGLYLALVETHERHLRAEASLRKRANGLLSPANQTNTKQHTVTGDDATAASSSRARHEKTKTVPRDGDDEKNHHRHLLSPEAARVALTLRRDFERGGIHLDDRRRATLERASSAVVRHGMAFQRNLVDRDALGFLDATKSELGGLPPSSAAAIAFGTSERARVPLDQRTLGACMRWLESRNARERVYKAAYAGPEANKAALTELLRARAEVAQSLGFESHAAYAVAPLMAGTPEAVRATLRAASDATDDRLAEEAMVMRGFFTRSSRNTPVAVRSWDRAFLARRAREALFKNKTAAAGEYFGAVAVARGVSRLAERVFGVSLAFQEMLPGEAWCADARKLVARDAETNEALGVIYLDLVARRGKFPHAAHFVVRCGRERGSSDAEGRGNQKKTLPSVALVCNFGGGASTTFEDTHLTHSELETFMHELGHAMHSILSTTEYQHLSGTRCAADLVEVPSHVFEYFAWDPDAISVLSAHRTTGDSMPASLLGVLQRSKDLFAATDLRQQLVFASADLETHAMMPTAPTSSGEAHPNNITHERVRAVAARVGREGFSPVNPHESSGNENDVEAQCAWELRFGHVVGYASTYYSYVYARLIAAEIWRRQFAGRALEPGAGRRFTEGILRKGGAVAPETLVRDLLGHDALMDVAGGIVPDNRAALRELEVK